MAPHRPPTPFDADKALTVAEAQSIIRELVAESGRIIPLHHCLQRMEERAISFGQVLRVLRRGQVAETPRFNEHRNWLVVVEGDASGAHLRIVGAIDRDRAGHLLLVITVVVLTADGEEE